MMQNGSMRFKLLSALVVLFLFLVRPAHGQTDTLAIDPAVLEGEIRSLLPALKEREAGMVALEKLQTLRDARVLRIFEHIKSNSLYEWNGQIVYGPAVRVDPDRGRVIDIYDLFTELDDAGVPLGLPLETVPSSDLTKSSFSPQRLVRTNVLNAVRVLGLKINDTKIRRTAARDLGNNRQAEALPDLRDVAANDTSPKVRHEAEESIAIIVASGADTSATPDQRLAAIAKLGELTSIRSVGVLQEISAKPGATDAEKAAVVQAIKQIDRHRNITDWIKNIFFGLSAGSIFVLLALGLAITFGLMGVINMAHGEMLMIGAITTWACYEFIGRALPPAYFNYYYIIALPLSFLAAATVGWLIEISIVRHLYKRPLDSLLATIGVSYVLIQAVRLWKGDNLGMRGPTWAGGNWEIYQDINLPFNRIFLIVLTIFCVLLVVGLFRYTRIGLMMRATVQNREMAQALGVNTRRVDMFTFAFGAGLAGLAGYGIVLADNPKPDMGQTYIVKTFLTVVVGGVGKLAGVVFSGLGIGFSEKLLEPITLIEKPLKIFDATWAQVATLLIVILFMQRKPGGLFPDKGRMADQADKTSSPLIAKTTVKMDVLIGSVMVLLGLVLVPILYGTGMMSLELVNKLGYVVAFAICAIGLDLIWGYIGVLSLCQFMFFALGGYCMGLYLINHGPQSADGIPMALSYVMSDVGQRAPPWFLQYFNSFPVAVFLGLLLPGLVALLIGLSTFRSRVRGVYFSILTQAMTVAAWLIFQKNDIKLGGTNGLTNFTEIMGYPIAASADAGPFSQTRFWLYVASCVTLLVVMLVAKIAVNSGFGRVLVAIRDDETRLRFVGYQTWAYKAAAFTLAGIFAAIGGMLYVPQKGIITPSDMAAGASILVVAWVAIGGRGSLWGAVIGAISVSLLYDFMTSWKPDYWLFVLGGLFILVPLMLPGGLMSLPMLVARALRSRKSITPREKVEPVAVKGGVS